MDWSNERYVRIYTRDTTAMRLMPWDELFPFWELLRKVDRAGVLDLEGHGVRGLAAHLRTPLDVTERALAAWVAAGWVELHGEDRLVVPTHLDAQEATASDAARARTARERRRASAMAEVPRDATVTNRDATVTRRDATITGRDATVDANVAITTDAERAKTERGRQRSAAMTITRRDATVTNRDATVTRRDQTVTRRHAASRGVTPSVPSVPSVPSDPEEEKSAQPTPESKKSPDRHREKKPRRQRGSPGPSPQPLPENWAPTEQHRAFADANGLDVALEAFGFRGHFEGQSRASWNGSFATWLANAVKFRRRDAGNREERAHAERKAQGLSIDGLTDKRPRPSPEPARIVSEENSRLLAEVRAKQEAQAAALPPVVLRTVPGPKTEAELEAERQRQAAALAAEMEREEAAHA